MEATIRTTNRDLNPINPRIDEVSEKVQDYVDSFDQYSYGEYMRKEVAEEMAEVAAQKPIKKMDKEVEKITLQFLKWYGNEPWANARMKHDENLRMVFIEVPILSNHTIEFLTCGHSYGIAPLSETHIKLSIFLNIWR